MTVVISIIRPSSPKSPFWPFTVHMVKLHFVLLNQILITVLQSCLYLWIHTVTVFVDKLVFCLVFCGPLFIFWLTFALTVIRFKTYHYQGFIYKSLLLPFRGFRHQKKMQQYFSAKRWCWQLNKIVYSHINWKKIWVTKSK